MKNSTIKKFTKKHYLENDSTVKKLNKVLKVLFPVETYGKTKGTYNFYFANSEDKKEWDMEDTNPDNRPVIKVSEFFKKPVTMEYQEATETSPACMSLVEKKPTVFQPSADFDQMLKTGKTDSKGYNIPPQANPIGAVLTKTEEPEVIESITVNFMPEIGVYTTERTNNQLEPVALIQRLSDGTNRITKL